MTFGLLITLATGLWLVSCGASVLALYWDRRAGARRWRAALVACGVGLLVGYGGWSRIQISASQTVNGQLRWSINSSWFFLGALVLGAIALMVTLWTWWKSRRPSVVAALPGTGEGESGIEPGCR